MDHNIKMNPMTEEHTTKPPHPYRPLQMEQRSRDAAYQNIAKPKQTEPEYDLVLDPVTNVHTQQLPNVYQSLEQAQRQKDEVYQGLSTGGAGSDDIKTAMKKMKIVLLVTVTVNIVVLLLLIALGILGGILIQSKFVQVMSRQHESNR